MPGGAWDPIHSFAARETPALDLPIPAGIEASQLWTQDSATSAAWFADTSTFLAAMPQPMSTPTAEGITAVSVGMTEPMVAP